MGTPIVSWERRLLAMAHEGSEQDRWPELESGEAGLLARAYMHCDGIAALHSRTFYTASGLLPEPKRRAVRALYAFCRVTDDLIDRSEGDLAAGLQAWRECALAVPPPCDDPVALAWHDTRTRYRIPTRYAGQLVEEVANDLITTRYRTFDELAIYCYGVASTVGLMSMHIIGFTGGQAIPYAVKMGVALQLTNILRDVAEDWRAGRVYLPQEELAAFGLSDEYIAAAVTASQTGGRGDDRWRAFMRFQVERNRQLYAEAMPGIAHLDPTGRFAIAAAAELYRAILNDIEAHDGDVFSRRAHVSTPGKLRRLPGIWWRVRRMRAPEQPGDGVRSPEGALPDREAATSTLASCHDRA